jgi:hypothetical protein
MMSEYDLVKSGYQPVCVCEWNYHFCDKKMAILQTTYDELGKW